MAENFMNLPNKEGQDSTNLALEKIATSLGVTTDALNSAVNLANQSAQNATDKAIDLENRFENLTTQQQQDAEVIDARQGKANLSANLTGIKDDLVSHKAESASKHISESGENENGRYVKYDDGTMICYTNGANGRYIVDNIEFLEAKLGLYYRDVDIIFPALFLGVPVITPRISRSAGSVLNSEYIFGNRGGSNSANRVTVYKTDKPSSDEGSLVANLHYSAIGRWK